MKKCFRQNVVCAIFLSSVLITGCSELKPPAPEPFYAVTVPPPRQELRWSNGKMPKSFDPAQAATAPETDFVRAIYEGLTELDTRTLNEKPAAAEKWESTSDFKTWTFRLRRDVRWSNGERVTANDFVRSWKRLSSLGDKAANAHLFRNIVGMSGNAPGNIVNEPSDFIAPVPAEPENTPVADTQTPGLTFEPPPIEETAPPPPPRNKARSFGVEAVDDATLKVSLNLPDKDFAKLVANPIFRPVYKGSDFEKGRPDPDLVTNGSFRIAKSTDAGITLDRSESYWNRENVKLERVHFAYLKNSEATLEAYRRGDLDLVTNTAFEPLVLKLLAPYEDFRRTAFNAVNFYEFNTAKAPFSDRRVREALAISIDRGKLTEGELEGMMRPANSFFPVGERTEALAFDAEKAKDLLEKAGFPGGAGFPAVRLVINRNDAQHRVARSVARMWKQNLSIETVIVIKEPFEIDDIRIARDYDVLRRGVVLPVNDEMVNLASIFGEDTKIATTQPLTASPTPVKKGGPAGTSEGTVVEGEPRGIKTQQDALYDLRAMPLYFPISYSLAKPYLIGYEINSLDTILLSDISIDNEWQPKP